ncbi:MAG TPA: hypothetical protein VE954_25965 [Oligoflexus sp.]|uniref:hypothetical protein n=1 Tax=Oligoflexus sp. TaxID=1971216 RepID=UPI002D302CDF|nr:hypothetical protein [Oligoflexus sp.]HYX36570.1 hypothetical protein [Oligoflexus sp.]
MKKMRVLTLIITAFVSRQALAHEAEEASVGLTLRDKAVEVRLNIDVDSWVEGITGLPLPMEHPEALEPMLLIARNNLQQMVLTVGGKKVDLVLVQFPAAEELIHEAEDHGHSGHMRSTVILKGTLTTPAQGEVALSAPKEMGPVIMSFYQPKTLWVPAASKAHFKVDAPRAAKKIPESRSFWIWCMGMTFAVLSLGIWYKTSRNPQVAA